MKEKNEHIESIKNEIIETYQYCNELSDRINIIGQAIIALEKRLRTLEENATSD